MSRCIRCGEEGPAYTFCVLEVQTLSLREISGERRVQALGLFHEWAVCGGCAEARLEASLRPGGRLVRKCLPFLLVLVAGIVLTAFARGENMVVRLLGPAAVFCGLSGSLSGCRGELARRKSWQALPREEALRQAAWACLLETAPKKDGENDLTYIPVDEMTSCLEPRELMERYDLLPAIAVKAGELMRGDTA